MKSTTPKALIYAEVLKLAAEKAEDFMKLTQGFFHVQKQQKNFAKKLSESVKDWGKLLCIVRRDWLKARETNAVSVTASFVDHCKNIFGSEPHNKAQSCSKAFDIYMLTGLITETDYDDNTSEALQRAAGIASAVGDDLKHPAIAEAATILKRRPEKAIAMLKEIRARIQTVVENEGEENESKKVVFLSPEDYAKQSVEGTVVDAHEQIDEIMKAGHVGAVIAAIMALAQTTADPETARALVHMTAQMGDKLAMNVEPQIAGSSEPAKRRYTVEQLTTWAGEVTPPQRVTRETLKADYFSAQERMEVIGETVGEETLNEWVEARQKAQADDAPAAETPSANEPAAVPAGE
jgi:hypothetical protein